MRIQSIDSTSYSGLKIANIKVKSGNLSEEYVLYNLTPKDMAFMKDLRESINVNDRMSGLGMYQYELWHNIIDNGLSMAIKEDNQGILLSDKNRYPCGFMRYKKGDNQWRVKYVSTWPVEKDKRKLLAGKSMFMKLFQDFIDGESYSIELDALRYSAFDPISRYLELGFKMKGGDSPLSETMTIGRESIAKSIEKFKTKIKVEPEEIPVTVNLHRELNLYF